MPDTRKFILRLSIVIIVLVFIAGCEPAKKKDNSVRLYVDAVSLAGSNEPNQAIDKLRQAINTNPRFAMAYSLLGSIYFQQNKLYESSQAYQRATQINPWSYEDFRDLGRVYRMMEDFNSAARAYAKACQLDPQSSESLCAAADSYYKLGDYESALQYGQSARGLAPSDSEVEKLLGDIYTARQDNDLAVESYKRAIELKNDDPNLKISLSVVYLRAEQYDSAKQLLESVALVEPLNAEVWRHLGFVYLKLNETDLSIGNYLRAVALAPDDWRGHKGLGVAYMMKYKALKDIEDPNAADFRTRALSHWSRSLDLNPAQDKLLKLYRKYTK
ncbi:MAG: tetratricopeptide repeat protein [Sedimentisphaerales bacterium]